MRLYSISGGRLAVPRCRPSGGGAVYHTCSCAHSMKGMKGGAVPMLIDPYHGTTIGGGMDKLKTKIEKMNMKTKKSRKYISL